MCWLETKQGCLWPYLDTYGKNQTPSNCCLPILFISVPDYLSLLLRSPQKGYGISALFPTQWRNRVGPTDITMSKPKQSLKHGDQGASDATKDSEGYCAVARQSSYDLSQGHVTDLDTGEYLDGFLEEYFGEEGTSNSNMKWPDKVVGGGKVNDRRKPK